MFSKKLNEECGVFGVYSKTSGAHVVSETYHALYALQHRGQESCGIAVCDDGVIQYHRDMGLVPDVFTKDILDKLGGGNMAMGHVRYSTHERKSRSNAQPLVVRHIKGTMSLAHNGSLTNAAELRESLEMQGAIFHSVNDAEVISYMITRARLRTPSIEQAVEEAMRDIKGAYSLIVMSPSKLIAARDPHGFRPLCMGELDGGTIFASESCALDSLGATFLRDLEPGEIVVVNADGTRSITTHCGGSDGFCVFEFIYFARPDSVIAGASVHGARVRAGEFLAAEHPVEADVVIGVPDSGLDAALGYARKSGIPYGIGFIKNRYVGRTFIQPTQEERVNSLRIKLNTIEATIKNKRVVVVEDSIVRGTTLDRAIGLVREAGAKEIHLRIAAPPYLYPCYYGPDIDSRESLIACRMTLPEMRDYLGVDSLAFLPVDYVTKLAEGAKCGFCAGCFTGEYPAETPLRTGGDKYENKLHG